MTDTKTHCPDCGASLRRFLKKAVMLTPKPWIYLRKVCEGCMYMSDTLLVVNGKTGKAGDPLNEFEKDILGSTTYYHDRGMDD